jgi:monoamine oxidase
MFGPEGAAPFTLRGDYPRVTWPTPSRGRDGSRILNTMAVCEDVQELAGVLARGPESVRRLLETRLPEMAPLRGVTWHDWSQDPLAGGVWIWHRNGAPNVSHPARAGRVVFAGSDLSSHSGWIEGALASAEAATALVTER